MKENINLLEVVKFTKKEVIERYSDEYNADLQMNIDLHKNYVRAERIKVFSALIGMFFFFFGFYTPGVVFLLIAFGVVADMRLDNRYYRFIRNYSTIDDWICFYHTSILLWLKSEISKVRITFNKGLAYVYVNENSSSNKFALVVKVIVKDGINHPVLDILNEEIIVPIHINDGTYDILKVLQ